MALVDISDPKCILPETLIFDASILLELGIGSRNKTQRTIRRFMNRLHREAQAGQVMCLVPISTLEECYFKFLQVNYTNELPKYRSTLESTGRKATWHELYKANPNLIKNFLPQLKLFREAILALPIVVLEPQYLEPIQDTKSVSTSLEDRMLHFIGSVPILPKDAYLLAVAERLNVPHIVTLDRDFQTVAGVNIYTIV